MSKNYEIFKLIGFDFIQELNGDMYRYETYFIHIIPDYDYIGFYYTMYENIPLYYTNYPYRVEIDGFNASYSTNKYEEFENYLSIKFKEKLRKHKIKLLLI